MNLVLGVAGILAAYVAMAIAVAIMNILLARAWPGAMQATKDGQTPPTGYIALNLVLGAGIAGASAIITAIIAPDPQMTWVQAYAALVFVLGIGYATKQRGGPQPNWYLYALPIVSAFAIWHGGRRFLS